MARALETSSSPEKDTAVAPPSRVMPAAKADGTSSSSDVALPLLCGSAHRIWSGHDKRRTRLAGQIGRAAHRYQLKERSIIVPFRYVEKQRQSLYGAYVHPACQTVATFPEGLPCALPKNVILNQGPTTHRTPLEESVPLFSTQHLEVVEQSWVSRARHAGPSLHRTEKVPPVFRTRLQARTRRPIAAESMKQTVCAPRLPPIEVVRPCSLTPADGKSNQPENQEDGRYYPQKMERESCSKKD
jgi:hypothetical protein